MPIDENTGKRRPATETKCIIVTKKHAKGKNYGQIARETTVSKSDPQRSVKQWKNTKKFKPPPHLGFKPKLDVGARM